MKTFELITDSSCDLSAAMAESLGITVIPLAFTLGDKTYLNYLDERDIPFKEVYRLLRTSIAASTTAVNIEQHKEVMKPLLDAGKDLLLLSFSSGLSATYSFGASAVQELSEQYPGRVIRSVDTKCASLGQGLLVYSCATLANEGKSLQEVMDFALRNIPCLNHCFTCDTLHRLRMGGRISATTALFGGLLNIKPILCVDRDGRLVSMDKARGRNASITALADKVAERIVNPADQTIFISHGDCLEDAEKLMAKIQAKVAVKGFEVSYVGPVIGAHSGAGTLAVFFYGVER